MRDFFIFRPMRKIPILGAIALFISALGCKEAKEVTASHNSSPYSISESSVANTLEYLSSDDLKGRATGTAGIEQAATYIEDEFEAHGLKPYFRSYRDTFEVEGVTGYNMVALKEGTDPALKDEYIIIGGHYDHVGFARKVGMDSIANGANDNAAGTAAVLELARYFSNRDTKRSLLFTLFSAEEMGLIGAKHLAGKLNAAPLDLYVMFNIEMIGVPMKNNDYMAYLTGYNKSNLAEKFNRYAGKEVLGFLPEAEKFRLFERSDNHPFYQEFNVPAQTISTFDFSNYDYYHHVKDEFEHMDTAHMTELIEAIAPGLTEMANSPEREIQMAE